MIVVDTSALYAIAFEEDDAERLLNVLIRTDVALVGSATAFELNLVVHRRHGRDLLPKAETMLTGPPIQIVPWEPALVQIATDALVRFGGRPARLNFGDCMAYALARHHDVPLLYKGKDFAATDIRSALDQ